MQRSGTTLTSRALQGHPNTCGFVDEFKAEPFFSHGVECFAIGGHIKWERARNSSALFDAVKIYELDAPDPGGKLVGYNGTPGIPKGDIMANGLAVVAG